MQTLWQDLKFALRMLAKNPGFTSIAMLTLALGIGANTAIFSVVHTVLLEPLPYPGSSRLISILQTDSRNGARSLSLSRPKFQQIADQSKTLESVTVYYLREMSLATSREPEVVSGARVSGDFFHVLGVAPALGRAFLPQEDQQGAADVAIVTDGFWHSHFAANEDVLGKTLVLDGGDATIVGVLPPSFRFPFGSPEPQVWLTREMDHPLLRPAQVSLGAGYLSGIARLRPGETFAQAKAELETINARYAQEFASHADGPNHGIDVQSLRDNLVAGLRRSLLVLLAAVGFVLLIACANVANLLLARATAREKELALRKALGASRGRLVVQLLSESFVLSLFGGVLGVLLAFSLMPVLRSVKDASVPRLADVRLDATVLLFSLLLCMVTAALFGLAPSLQAAGKQLQDALKEGLRGSSGSGHSGMSRKILIVAETAIALVLMTGAGLLIESFARLTSVNLGFNPKGITTIPIALPASRYAKPEQQAEFFRQALQRVKSLPAVQSAGFVSFLPLSGAYRLSYFCFEGQICQGLGKDPLVPFWQVTSGYFETMDTRLLSGRFFDEHDISGAAPVILVNETTAKHYWPNENPIGKHVSGSRDLVPREIVGVVADAKIGSLSDAGTDQLYVPAEQMPYAAMTLVIRSSEQATPLVDAIRAKIAEVDPTLPLAGIRSMGTVISASLAQPRIITQITGLFAGFALLLAGIGIYGVIAYSVSIRKQEMGIRLALGARPSDILRLVVGQGMRITLIGVVLGVVFSLALTRLLASLLFGVRATDPLVFSAAAIVLLVTALFACSLPALRATRVDPIVVLRCE
ncbi:MAG TPA: ABC transporter permease [Candidatus Methylomirabilis sp.]|nr:ABC transporter permease [Candidatus Methylomirabilis sp.]